MCVLGNNVRFVLAPMCVLGNNVRFVLAPMCVLGSSGFICYLYLFTYTIVQHYSIMFVSFNTTTTGATSGANTACSFRSTYINPRILVEFVFLNL